MGKRGSQRIQTLKMPDGEKVEFDAKGRVLMSRSAQWLWGGGLILIGCTLAGMPWRARSSAQASAERLGRMRGFPETTCTIKDITWGEPDQESGTRVSVDYQVHVEGKGTFQASGYAWDGNTEDNQDAASKKRVLLPGKRVPCWYDPADPTNALLEQARTEIPPPMSAGLLWGLTAVGLVLVGAGIGMARSKKRFAIGGDDLPG